GYPAMPGYGPVRSGPAGYPGYPASRWAPATPDGMPLAGAGWRLLARILDGIPVAVLTLVLGFGFIGSILDATRSYLDKVQAAADHNGPQPGPFDLYTTPGFLSGYVRLIGVYVAVNIAYNVVFIALRGATPGKLAVGIRVRPWEAEGRPGWGRAVKRVLCYEVASVVPFLGGWYTLLDELWLLWDPRRQCLHDKWPGTVVVRTRR
ncbi:MAG TPA: RDD family protein, partial [Kineosporiaceae bacterium]